MIPKLHYISQGANPEDHLNAITSACSSGAELVQLRLKNLDNATLLKTAEKAREITLHYHTRLIINDHYKIAKAVKADGVHLGKTDTCPLQARKQLYSWQIIGGTANSLQDCESLLEKKVDYIGLGPFRFTKTKKNLGSILGLKSYTTILKSLETKTPIVAIGGITLKDVPELLEAGVYGIAASGEITRDFNKVNQFHNILNTPSKHEQVWNINQNS